MSMVLLGHLGGRLHSATGETSPELQLCNIFTNGTIGSSFFLLITGYVVYSRCRDDVSFSWRAFLRSRALRILPLYWIVLGGYAAFDILTGFRGKMPADWGQAALILLQNCSLLAPFSHSPVLISVTWTLTYVGIGYLTIPLLARGFSFAKLQSPARLLAITAFGAIWIAFSAAVPVILGSGVNLALGMLVCEAGRAGVLRHIRTRVADIAGTAGLVASLVVLANLSSREPWFPAGARPGLRLLAITVPLAILLAGRIGTSGWLNRALTSRAAQWIGRTSYSAYFAHGAALLALQELIVANRPWLVQAAPARILLGTGLCAGYALSLLAAAALYYAVEAPLERRLRPHVRAIPVEVPQPVSARSRSAVA
jgi:peptidoglycan/LPS O-acetylase OafA/YrhL